MRGRQVFMSSLVQEGVTRLFGNPGTTENPVLDSLGDYPGVHYYTTLHEGVAVGAARGYTAASGEPSAVNLHVAPGLGNGIGMIYAALKSRTPMLVTAGQQDTRMRLRNPLLSHDLAAMAAPVVKWAGEPRCADELAPMLRQAFKIAREPPAGPVFVSLPVDVMEQETDLAAEAPARVYARTQVDADGLAALAQALLASRAPALVAGDEVAMADANADLKALSECLGAPVWHEALRTLAALPGDHPANQGRLPFEAASIRRALADRDLILMIGSELADEIWFDPGPVFPAQCVLAQITDSHQSLARRQRVDIGLIGALGEAMASLREAVAARGGAAWEQAAGERIARMQAERESRQAELEASLARIRDLRPMTPRWAISELFRCLPADVVIVDEAITAYPDVAALAPVRARRDYIGGRGGGIGQGIAAALGVQVAFPGRPVVAITGDGSAMYSISALWTAAHHRLPILFVVLSNREYRVLKHNIDTYRQRYDAASNRDYPHMDLTDPVLDFVAMARGMGVAGEQVTEPGALAAAVERGLGSGAPYLLDVVISGKP